MVAPELRGLKTQNEQGGNMGVTMVFVFLCKICIKCVKKKGGNLLVQTGEKSSWMEKEGWRRDSRRQNSRKRDNFTGNMRDFAAFLFLLPKKWLVRISLSGFHFYDCIWGVIF